MKYLAAIFDLDGTLLNTLADLADSMNGALYDFGMPTHPIDAYKFFVGDGMEMLAKRVVPDGTTDSQIGEMIRLMGENYSQGWSHLTNPYPGIVEALAELKKRGLKLGVLSNKPDKFTQIMVKHYFGDTFDVVRGALEGVPKKPDPTAALALARELGVEPESILYFGDTNTDMKTGLAAGMRTVGVTWGFRPLDELIGAGADAIIDSPMEVLECVK